jgi:hypothetical protein
MEMKKTLLYLLVFTGLLTSCKWVDTDINVDPDAPQNPSLYLILPSVEAYTAYNTQTFDVAGVTGMWTQQISGAARQAASINNYEYKEGDVANAWDNFYASAMVNANTIIKMADSVGKPYYKGAAQILMAYNLGLATQLWGDVPYSECFRGEGNLNPHYESQQSIYEAILDMLDDAIANLSGAENTVGYSLKDGDMIYKGDPNLWIATAHVLKARFYMHIAKRVPGSYQKALDELAIAHYGSSRQNFGFPTGTDYYELAPLVEYDAFRADWGNSEYFQNLMENDHGTDPRNGTLWIDPTGNAGFIWNILYGAKVSFITYTEQEFIKAEALYRVGYEDSAKVVLDSAVSSSLQELYCFDKDWKSDFEADVDALSGADLLHEIMMQKYIALFLQPEAFVDWRRTGIPELTPVVGTEIPRRFPYSSNERSYNKNIPSLVSIFARNWFDSESK